MAMNFDILERRYRLKVDNIKNPFEVAKLAYYFHFLGPDRGVKLIKDRGVSCSELCPHPRNPALRSPSRGASPGRTPRICGSCTAVRGSWC